MQVLASEHFSQLLAAALQEEQVPSGSIKVTSEQLRHCNCPLKAHCTHPGKAEEHDEHCELLR
jgi:hypothetical protein